MDLKNYLSPMSLEMRDEFAQRCMTSKGHLQNIMYGMKPCAPGLAVLIEQESRHKVKRQDLRPDDYHLIWPDLRKVKRAADKAVTHE